jgi:hypothetical protein
MWWKFARGGEGYYKNKLYHGGLKENADSVRQIGVIPQVGEFVENAYGGEYEDDDVWDEAVEASEASYWATYAELQKAVTAMRWHIANKKGIYMDQVTPLDIKEFGMLAMTHPNEDFFQVAEDDYDTHLKYNSDTGTFSDKWWKPENMVGPEPGDVFTQSYHSPDKVFTGKKLMRLLNKLNMPNRKDQMGRQEHMRKFREEKRQNNV